MRYQLGNLTNWGCTRALRPRGKQAPAQVLNLHLSPASSWHGPSESSHRPTQTQDWEKLSYLALFTSWVFPFLATVSARPIICESNKESKETHWNSELWFPNGLHSKYLKYSCTATNRNFSDSHGKQTRRITYDRFLNAVRQIIPVRCFSCGKVIGDKWNAYLELLANDNSEGSVCFLLLLQVHPSITFLVTHLTRSNLNGTAVAEWFSHMSIWLRSCCTIIVSHPYFHWMLNDLDFLFFFFTAMERTKDKQAFA